MAEMDEFNPKSWANVEIKPGLYVFETEVKKCTFRDTDKEKAYMQIVFLVIEGDMDGLEIDNRVYISKAAEWRARYFLAKFDYPEELLKSDPPRLIKSKIEGLRGKILAEYDIDNFGMLKCDIKKFDHINGDECEKEMEKKLKTQEKLPLTPSTDAEPTHTVDLNADVAKEEILDAEVVEDLPAAGEPDLSNLD